MSTQTTSRSTSEIAGELRTVVGRLAFHLRAPAVRQGITPTRLSAMAALQRNGPQRPGDLAVRLGVRPASMSRLAETLEVGGWVSRGPDPDDRRASLLSITKRGVSALEGLRREGTSALSEDIDALTARQREVLSAALPVLATLADRHIDGIPN